MSARLSISGKAIEINTYSVVGRCARTGQLGVAIASAVPAVGAICPYIRPNIGAVSTQSWVNPYIALRILEALEGGADAEIALKQGLGGDDEAGLRQVGVVDRRGGSASWTGEHCTPWCGQLTGSDYAIQGNMLTGPDVLSVMRDAFVASASDPLANRLLQVLEAGQGIGGDKRGRQSAGLRVFADQSYALVDLRVDEHADPVSELRRIYRVAEQQLLPFIAGMPKNGSASAFPRSVIDLLLRSPGRRPGGGGNNLP